MSKLFSSPPRKTEIVIALIAVIIGFLLVTQLRGQAAISRSLKAQSEEDLGQIIYDLNREIDILQSEVVDSKFKLADYEQKEVGRKAILREAEENLDKLKVMAGYGEVEGPGVVILIIDREGLLSTFDFFDIVHELRAAGAEAISIDGVRVTANTYFQKKRNSVYVDGRRIGKECEVKAIGDPETLYQGITISGGLESKLSSLQGLEMKVAKKIKVIVPSAVR